MNASEPAAPPPLNDTKRKKFTVFAIVFREHRLVLGYADLRMNEDTVDG